MDADYHKSALPYSFKSNGSTKAGVIKAGAGQLFGIHPIKRNSAPCYLRLYDQVTPPATTATPVYRLLFTSQDVPPPVFPLGLAFSVGIAYRITTGEADDDDTAVPADDAIVSLNYR